MSLAQTIRFAKVSRRLGRMAGKSPREIEQARDERLRRLLRQAVTVPFYREKYKGLDLDQIPLSRLPTTKKQELMENFDAAVTDPAVRRADVENFMADPSNIGQWFLGRYCVSHTSGSQGQPLILIQDRYCLELMFAATTTRAYSRGKPDLLQGLSRILRPTRVAVVSMIGFSASGHAFTFMPELVGGFVRMTRLSPTQPDLIERLNAVRPHVIVAYPSILDWLAAQSHRLRLARSSLRHLGSFGEQFGIFIDPIYGAKSWMIMEERERRHLERKDRPALFWHCGYTPNWQDYRVDLRIKS